MKLYGDINKSSHDGVIQYPLASGKFSSDLEELKRGRAVFRSDNTIPSQFEMLTASGAVASHAKKTYGLHNVYGRLFFIAEEWYGGVTDALMEYNLDNNTHTMVTQPFGGNHWYSDAWRGLYISDTQSYDVLADIKYDHVGDHPSSFCRPFEYRGELFSFNQYQPFKYNTSGHLWEQVNTSDYFGGFNFFTESVKIDRAFVHRGKLLLMSSSQTSAGRARNAIYTFDGVEVQRINPDPWADSNDDVGPQAMFKLNGKVYISDRVGDIYNLKDGTSFIKEFSVPNGPISEGSGWLAIDNVNILPYGDEVIFQLIGSPAPFTSSSGMGIYAFNGSRFKELGDWNTQFPGTLADGMTILNGYLYALGGIHLSSGTHFMARMKLPEIKNVENNDMHHVLSSDQEVLSASFVLKEDIQASGAALDARTVTMETFANVASGDLYGSNGRGWEEIVRAPFISERRPYYFKAWRGDIHIIATDEDKIVKLNLDTKAVENVRTGFTAAFPAIGIDSDGHSAMQEMIIGDPDVWDGRTFYDLATPTGGGIAGKLFGKIFYFDGSGEVYIWSGSSWTDISHWTAWDVLGAGSFSVTSTCECRGKAFMYKHAPTDRQILIWNGDPDTNSQVAFTDGGAVDSTQMALVKLHNNVYVFMHGGTNEGRIYKFNFANNTFEQLVANCGYDIHCQSNRHPQMVIHNDEAYIVGEKHADSSLWLLRFDGNDVAEEVEINLNGTNSDVTILNGVIYLIDYSDGSTNTTRIYRYIKGPLNEANYVRAQSDRIETEAFRRIMPPSGFNLPSAASSGYAPNYGDGFYHMTSGYYKYGHNEWERLSKEEVVYADWYEDSTGTGGTNLNMPSGDTWYTYVSTSSSGGDHTHGNLTTDASGITINDAHYAGAYSASYSVTFAGSINTVFYVGLFVDGVLQANTVAGRKIGAAAGDVGNLGSQGIISVGANERVELRVKAPGAAKSVDIEAFNVTLLRQDHHN
jgi:hypothetical protein